MIHPALQPSKISKVSVPGPVRRKQPVPDVFFGHSVPYAGRKKSPLKWAAMAVADALAIGAIVYAADTAIAPHSDHPHETPGCVEQQTGSAPMMTLPPGPHAHEDEHEHPVQLAPGSTAQPSKPSAVQCEEEPGHDHVSSLEKSGVVAFLHLLWNMAMSAGWLSYGTYRGAKRRDRQNMDFAELTGNLKNLSAKGGNFDVVQISPTEFKVVIKNPPAAQPGDSDTDKQR